MKRLKIGLNGFGRIGRAFTRVATKRNSFDIVVINTRTTEPNMLAYLLKYDSVYRTLEKEVRAEQGGIIIDGVKIATTLSVKPEEIPWEKYGVEVVIDATGAFTKKTDLQKHLRGTVKKVILTTPSEDENIQHVVLGVNDHQLDFNTLDVISNASCTTNCVSPMFKVLDDNFKIISGFLTTSHAYTQTQSLLDDANKKIERSRAASLNIVPSTTGAAKAVVKTLPNLKDKIDGMAIRIPIPIVSFSDISAVVEKPTTIEEVNKVFQEPSETTMKGILDYETAVLVSSDFIGSPYSCIFDSNYTKVINGNLIKIFGWYDNEWGYSERLADLVEKIAQYV